MRVRDSERGNIFFMLFGAVALVGVVAAATSTLMRGPLSTVVNVNQRAKADTQMQIASKLAMVRAAQQPSSGDCDGDGTVEPLHPETLASGPSGGGGLPSSIGATTEDPWGTRYGYCTWDLGATVSDPACNPGAGEVADLVGGNNNSYPVMIIVSAGPDRTFQTDCNAWVDTTPADDIPDNYNDIGSSVVGDVIYKPIASDDIVISYTYSEAVEAAGGLWSIKTGDPTKITTAKDIDIQSNTSFASGKTATFQGAANFDSGARLDLGAGATGGLFLLPDQFKLPNCNAANNGSLRLYYSSTNNNILQVCDNNAAPGGWTTIGGSGATITAGGNNGEIQYNSGGDLAGATGLTWNGVSGFLGIGGVPTVALDVTGAGKVSTTFDVGTDLTTGGHIDATSYVQGSQFRFDASNYIHFNSGSNMAFATGGSDRVYIDTTGNVGIGVSNPSHSLDVSGDAYVSGLAYADRFIANTSGTAAAPAFSFSSSGTGVFSSGADNIDFTTSGTSRAMITSTGLGVGTTPSQALDVAGSGLFTGSVQSGTGFLFSSSNGMFPTGGNISLNIGGVPQLYVTGLGVGVGQASPSAPLDVAGGIRIGQWVAACAGVAGSIRFNSSGDALEYCSNDGNWYTLASGGGGGGGSGGLWTNNTTYITRGSAHVIDPAQALPVALTGAGSRFVWYPAKYSFRAGAVTGAAWDDANIGNYSTGLGRDTQAMGDYSFAAGDNIGATGTASIGLGQNLTASGANSLAIGNDAIASAGNTIALGQKVTANATNAMALGLGNAAGAAPIVSGANSFGIFMGDRSGVALAGTNTMALLGGKFLVDQSPGLGPVVSGTLSLDVNGDLGAAQYCDEDGMNCFTAADITGGAVGVFEDASNVIRLTSGTVNYASADYVFGSPQLIDDGIAGHDSRFLFWKSAGAFRAGTATGTQWDTMGDQSIGLGLDTIATGNQSVSIGSNTTASGTYSVALGNKAQAGATNAMAIGLGQAAGAAPNVNSANSLGIFMGDQSGVTVSSANTMGLFGGKLVIDPNAPATQLTARGVLDLGAATDAVVMPYGDTLQRPAVAVNGMIRYNSTSNKFEGFQGGIWQDILTSAIAGGAAAPDRGIQFNSGNSFAADSTFVYTSAGYVGIGTATPAYALDVTGNVSVGPNLYIAGSTNNVFNSYSLTGNTAGQFVVYNRNSNAAAYTTIRGGGSSASHLDLQSGYGAGTTDYIRFMTGSQVERIRIDTNGNMGMGTTTPQAQLDIAGTGAILIPRGTTAQQPAGVNGMLRYNSQTGKFEGYQAGAWQDILTSAIAGGAAAPDRGVQFNSGNSFAADALFSYTSAGRLGIGTATPSSTLTVVGTDSSATPGALISAGSLRVTGQDNNGYQISLGANGAILADASAQLDATTWLRLYSGDYTTMYSGGSESARFTSAGRFGLGTAAPVTLFDMGTGTIRIGDGGEACGATYAGGIRYTSVGTLQYCNGTSWTSTANGGAAAGSNTYVQYNSGGAFGASANYTYDFTNNILGIGNTGTGSIRTGDGTVSLPGYAFTSDTDTGLYNIAANTLGVGTNGAVRITVQDPSTTDSSVVFNGSSAITLPIGDNTTRPSTGVDGMLRYNSASGKFEGYQGGTWQDILTSAIAGGAAAPDRGVQFNSGNSFAADALFSYTSAGRLGIGTATPSSTLTVVGTDSSATPGALISAGSLRVTGQDNNGYQISLGANGAILADASAQLDATTWLRLYSGDYTTMYSGGSESARFTSAGRFGLGTAAPVTLFDMGTGTIRIGDGGEACGATYAGGIRYTSSNTVQYCDSSSWITLAASGPAAAAAPDRGIQFNSGNLFAANSTFVYTSAGRLGVGTATPQYKLDVTENSNGVADGINVVNTGATGWSEINFGTNTFSRVLQVGVNVADNSAYMWNEQAASIGFGTDNTLRMTIQNPGTADSLVVFNGTGAITLPVGDTLERPSSGVNGMFRYNSSNGNFEGYQSGAWQAFQAGTAAAAGSNTYVQYNSGGIFGASANYTYDFTNNILGIGNTGTGSIRTGDGTVSLPGYAFTSDTDTGLYNIAANTLGVGTAGAVRVTVQDPSTTSSSVVFNGVDAITMPVGDTLQRPSAGANGMFRYNSSNGNFEGYQSGAWQAFQAGTAAAAGSNTYVQYNSGGTFGASANYTYDFTNNILGIGNTGTGSIRTGDGTVSLPGYAFTSDTDTGLYNIAANTLGVGTNGAVRITVQDPSTTDSSVVFNGSSAITLPIGDNTTRPSTGVDGMLRYNSASGKFEGYQGGTWQDILTSAIAGGAAAPDRGVQFNSGNSFAADALFSYTSAGRLGIGTATPSSTLTVVGTDSSATPGALISAGSLRVTGQDNNGYQISLGANGSILADASAQLDATTWLRLYSGDYTTMYSGGSESARFTSAGRFGLGTAAPVTLFDMGTGTIRIGDGGEACGATYAGGIRYTSVGTLQYCNGTSWTSTAAGSGVMALDDLSDAAVDYPSYNMFIGTGVGGTSSNGGNVGIGPSSLQSNTTGQANTAVGVFALQDNTSGDSNTAFGLSSLGSNTTGKENTALGQDASQASIDAIGITAVGHGAMVRFNNTSVNGAYLNNTAVGAGAMAGSPTFGNNTGNYNTALGNNALTALSGGSSNTAIGALALDSTSTGIQNTAVGESTLQSNVVGSRNTSVGEHGLYLSTGTDNTSLGWTSGDNITSGSYNIMIGSGVDAASATGDYQLNIGDFITGDMTSNGVMYVSSTGALRVPAGTTGEQPGGSNGMFRYNTTNGNFEGYQAGAWQAFQAGTAAAAGSSTYVQYNSGGVFGASANYTYDFTNNILGIGNTGTGSIRTGDGTVSLPGYAFTSDTDTGLYNIAANTLGVGTNGAVRITVQDPSTTSSSVIFNGTGAITLPIGDTSTRPSTGVDGMLRYNSQTGKFEGYQAGSWTDLITAGATAASPDRGIQFNSGNSFAADSTFVYTSAGRLGLGTATPSDDFSMSKSGSNDLVLGLRYLGTDQYTSPRLLLVRESSSTNRKIGEVSFESGIAAASIETWSDSADADGSEMTFRTSRNSGGSNTVMVMKQDGRIGIGTDTPEATFDISSTDAILIPRGTTAQQPAGVNGMLRYNSQTNKFEGYQAGSWQDIITAGGVVAINDLTDAIVNYTSESMYLGTGVGVTATSADNNTAVGVKSMQSVTSGRANTALGNNTLRDNTTGSANVAIGEFALISNNGNNNIAIGQDAMLNSTASGDSIAIGGGALSSVTAAGANIAIGYHAGDNITTGSSNLIIGKDVDAMSAAGDDQMNIRDTLFGDLANKRIRIGGSGALATAAELEVSGTGALLIPRGTTAQQPAGVNGMLRYNSQTNKFEGYQAGSWQDIITAGGVVAINDLTDAIVSYSSESMYLGTGVGASATAASLDNTAAGVGSMQGAVSGNGNSAFGKGALRSLTSANDNTAVGSEALGGNYGGVNVTGGSNTAIGAWALINNSSGNSNTAIGRRALQANTTGIENTALGVSALGQNVDGNGNVAIGQQAISAMTTGYNNIAIGSYVGGNLTSGSTNILIGYDIDAANATGDNQLNIGNLITADMTSSGIMYVSSTGALRVPIGTSAQQPSGSNGMIRYNTTSGKFEGYQAGAWTDIITAGGTAASPDRGIQFNSGNSFAASSGLTFTSVGSLNLGSSNTLSPSAVESAAFGLSNQISGTRSIAIGQYNAVFSDYSLAVGGGSVASGTGSMAVGDAAATYGSYSIAMGSEVRATGAGSLALGTRARTGSSYGGSGGDYSVAFGLGNAAGTTPYVSGTSSMGIFMGDHSGVAFTSSNTMGLFGGKFVIDPTVPATYLYPRTALDVNGTIKIGDGGEACSSTYAGGIRYTSVNTVQYCNGTSWGSLGAGGGGTPAGSNTQIQFNSGGSFGASSNFVWNNSTAAMTVTGNINYTGIITDTSDRRLKSDIMPLEKHGRMLDKFDQLGTYSFTMKDDPKKQVEFGVMAQEMQKVFPELVMTDYSRPEHYMSVNYMGMIAPLVQATKELKAENDNLKAELEQMKTERAEMHATLEDLAKDVKGLKAHTGYGISKASMGGMVLFILLGALGSGGILLISGHFRRRRGVSR